MPYAIPFGVAYHPLINILTLLPFSKNIDRVKEFKNIRRALELVARSNDPILREMVKDNIITEEDIKKETELHVNKVMKTKLRHTYDFPIGFSYASKQQINVCK